MKLLGILLINNGVFWWYVWVCWIYCLLSFVSVFLFNVEILNGYGVDWWLSEDVIFRMLCSFIVLLILECDVRICLSSVELVCGRLIIKIGFGVW